MKKILTIALLLFSIATFAQGNLQFNKIVNFKSGNNYTVPTGKVLKIVSINALSDVAVRLPLSSCNPNGIKGVWSNGSIVPVYFTDCIYDGLTYLKISNQKFDVSGQSNQNNPQNQCTSCPPFAGVSITSSTFNNFKLPIWLSSGEEVSVAQIDGLLISAIEFNIIP